MPNLEKYKALGLKFAQRASQTALHTAKTAAAKVKGGEVKKVAGDEYIVALDIGTEFVKALIGRVGDADSTIDIIGVGRSHQELSDMQAGAISDIAGVVANCDEAL